ncbi:MAG: hypothetical protein ACJAQT_004600 [Akkermansiaceae bacterium]
MRKGRVDPEPWPLCLIGGWLGPVFPEAKAIVIAPDKRCGKRLSIPADTDECVRDRDWAEQEEDEDCARSGFKVSRSLLASHNTGSSSWLKLGNKSR